ncbi:MAG: tRNA pseudouridine(38-40) synthase TruA [Victivallaceae bacterium]
MTCKYKLIIEYIGTYYSGWQKQPNKPTIQEETEKALSKIFRSKIIVIGSGRTDAGVHAVGQTAHITLPKPKKELSHLQLRNSLNALLPKDITIRALDPITDDFHARFSAKGKIYRYYITKRKKPSPFLEPFRHAISYPLDLKAMQNAASFLIGEHDFASFSNSGRTYKTTVRNINKLEIQEQDEDVIFEFSGNGFLYKMVRNITGTLIEIGKHKMKPKQIRDIMNTGNRIHAAETAPAKGLFLHQVLY